MESEEVADFHRDWVTSQAEREAMATKCLEAYFECGTNQIPESKRGLYNLMQEFIQIFLYDHRGDDVPDGRNRWEYLLELWKTGDDDYSLEDCLGIEAMLAKLDSEEDDKEEQHDYQ